MNLRILLDLQLKILFDLFFKKLSFINFKTTLTMKCVKNFNIYR